MGNDLLLNYSSLKKNFIDQTLFLRLQACIVSANQNVVVLEAWEP